MSFIGSICCSPLLYIFPALLSLKYDIQKNKSIKLDIILIIFGIFITISGLIGSIFDLFYLNKQ